MPLKLPTLTSNINKTFCSIFIHQDILKDNLNDLFSYKPISLTGVPYTISFNDKTLLKIDSQTTSSMNG